MKKMPAVIHWQRVLSFIGATACFLFYATVHALNGDIGVNARQQDVLQSDTTQHTDELINNRTLGFQKILAIDLPSRPDLRDAMLLAAHSTNLSLQLVNGVADFQDGSSPFRGRRTVTSPAAARAWRAHVHVARTMVEQNIATALVLESDVDWDFRIRYQMRKLAKAARQLQQLPIVADSHALRSPYGDTDNWDLLLLGHCDTQFPSDWNPSLLSEPTVAWADDQIAHENRYLNIEAENSQLLLKYPPRVRVTNDPSRATCSLAYAMTLSAARSLLSDVEVDSLGSLFDPRLRHACRGSTSRPLLRCIESRKHYFHRHIHREECLHISKAGNHSGSYEQSKAKDMLWSTLQAVPKLSSGQVSYVSQYPGAANGSNSAGYEAETATQTCLRLWQSGASKAIMVPRRMLAAVLRFWYNIARH